MAYSSFLSSCTFCTIAAPSPRSIPLLHAPRQSCYRTLVPPPLFLLRMHVTTGEVMTSVECRHAIGWKLTDVTGVSLYMRLDAIPPWTPCYLDRGSLFPSIVSRRTRRGAIGIEKWCTPVQSHSFPRLSDPRGRRAPLSPFLRRSPILPRLPSETLPSFSSCRDKGHSSYSLFADVCALSLHSSVHFISFHGILNLFEIVSAIILFS